MPETPVSERSLPHNLEAEKAVLGAVLIDNEQFNRAAELIDSPDFYRHAHQQIFDKIVSLTDRDEVIDLV
ncbi:MAG: replicative DNA helicase, partial [Acidobacteria bacterium]|nr:replicative DNA helicase [Acidobacteriota bacterium]